MKLGANLSARYKGSSTLLHVASEHGNVLLVRELAKLGAELDAPLKNGATPLFLAIQNGFTDCVKVLLEAGADVKKPTIITTGATALHVAVQHGRMDLVEELIKHGAPVDAKTKDGMTSLMSSESIEMVRGLAKLGANVNECMDNGATALHYAAQNGELEMVKLLVEELGAKVDVKTKEGATPLYFACVNGFLEVVNVLLKHKADPNSKLENGITPLYVACEHGHLEIITHLMKEGGDINARVQGGSSPIHIAASYGFTDIVKLLFNNGGDKTMEEHSPNNLLCAAAEKGQIGMMKEALKEMGAKVDARRKDGMTPLFLACYGGHTACVKLLLENGASVRGETPVSESLSSLLSSLTPSDYIQKGREAGVGLAFAANFTPLHVASFAGKTEVVKLLLEKGADLEAKDIEEATPLHR